MSGETVHARGKCRSRAEVSRLVEEYSSSKAFCRQHHLGRSTLTRRLQQQNLGAQPRPPPGWVRVELASARAGAGQSGGCRAAAGDDRRATHPGTCACSFHGVSRLDGAASAAAKTCRTSRMGLVFRSPPDARRVLIAGGRPSGHFSVARHALPASRGSSNLRAWPARGPAPRENAHRADVRSFFPGLPRVVGARWRNKWPGGT
jgi:hypothetical protein